MIDPMPPDAGVAHGLPPDDQLPRISVDGNAYGFCTVCGAPRGSKLWRDGDTYRMDGVCSANEAHAAFWTP